MLDSMTPSVQISAFSDELQKIAARKGLKLIRGLIGKGDPRSLAKANRMAITPGVLKKTQAGSQVKQLGAGMEGVSTLTAHPKRGIEVRKLIDPKGIAGEGMVANRETAGRALKGSPDVAEFRGARTTPSGIREQRFEYVPGREAAESAGETVTKKQWGPAQAPASAASAPEQVSTAVGSGATRRGGAAAPAKGPMTQEQRVSAQMKRLRLQGERKGFQVADLHEGNVMVPGGGGAGKAVDFIPVPKNQGPLGGFTTGVGLNRENFAKGMHAQQAASLGQRTKYLDYLEDPRRAGNLAARAYAGAPPLTPGSSTAIRHAKDTAKAKSLQGGTMQGLGRIGGAGGAAPMPRSAAQPAGGLSTAVSRPAAMPRKAIRAAQMPKPVRPAV